MKYCDLRDFIAQLELRGELKRVRAEVDPYLEITEICDRTLRSGGHSPGGKDRLLGISKRGDVYLRQRLIHGARAVLRFAERKDDPLSRWTVALKARRHANVATVALSNKLARIAYAILTTGQPYDANRTMSVAV